MHYEDIELSCVQCGEKFVFSRSEQQHWAKRGFVHKPKRCKKCRDERRARMQNFYGSSGGNQGIYRAPSFRNERNYKNEYRSPMSGSWKHQAREYEITCSKCSAKDTIPFKPAPGREIFCHACYEEVKKSGFRKKRSRPASRGQAADRPMPQQPAQEPSLQEAQPSQLEEQPVQGALPPESPPVEAEAPEQPVEAAQSPSPADEVDSPADPDAPPAPDDEPGETR
jgi:CxxC-x17-CxxC domain-containing protein